MNRRDFLRRAGVASAGLASLPVFADVAHADGADHVRWDIPSVDFSTTPTTLRPGGVAFASADMTGKIKLTGSGTFVAPASGKPSGAVTGGGTWETFEDTTSTGNGTYAVTRLVDWEFANFQSGMFIDLISTGERANGNVILRIEFSDGSNGILGVGCHGPGAPEGIQEGVIATKGFVTYWTRQAPAPGVDRNRTVFHLTK